MTDPKRLADIAESMGDYDDAERYRAMTDEQAARAAAEEMERIGFETAWIGDPDGPRGTRWYGAQVAAIILRVLREQRKDDVEIAKRNSDEWKDVESVLRQQLSASRQECIKSNQDWIEAQAAKTIAECERASAEQRELDARNALDASEARGKMLEGAVGQYKHRHEVHGEDACQCSACDSARKALSTTPTAGPRKTIVVQGDVKC